MRYSGWCPMVCACRLSLQSKSVQWCVRVGSLSNLQCPMVCACRLSLQSKVSNGVCVSALSPIYWTLSLTPFKPIS